MSARHRLAQKRLVGICVAGVMLALSWLWLWEPALYGHKGLGALRTLQDETQRQEQELRALKDTRNAIEEQSPLRRNERYEH